MIQEKLKKYGIWHKRHMKHHDDQFYQLRETPGYITSGQAEAYAEGMRSHEKAHIKALWDLGK